jgi:hypothetical protein
MRIAFEVEPADLSEVPVPATLIPLVFPDRRIHQAVVLETEMLEGGRMRLTCEMPIALLGTVWGPPAVAA